MREFFKNIFNDEMYSQPLLSSEMDQRATEDELIQLIHKTVTDMSQNTTLNRTELFFDMFPAKTTDDNSEVWCIPADHPISILMDRIWGIRCYNEAQIDGIQITLIVWYGDDVQDCMDRVMQRCGELGLKTSLDATFNVVVTE